MSVNKHFEKRNIELTEDNTLPVGQRSQKNVKRVIAAVRAAEADFNDEIREINERCRRTQEQLIAAQEEVHRLRSELLRVRLAESLENIEAISVAERTKLLEVAAA